MRLVQRIDTIFNFLSWVSDWITAFFFAFAYGQVAFLGFASLAFVLHWMGLRDPLLYKILFCSSLVPLTAVTIWATPKVYRRQQRGLIL